MNKAFEKIIDELKQESIIVDDDAGHRAVEIIEQIAEEYNNGWIPCTARLPEEYGDYLIWWTDITGNQYYEITEYEPNNGWIGDILQSFEGKYSVIAWQPLPEPLKERD